MSFHFEIQDFGPLEICSFDYKPMTILVGENNTGKSYSGMVLYSLLKFFEALCENSETKVRRIPTLGKRVKQLTEVSETVNQICIDYVNKISNNNIKFSEEHKKMIIDLIKENIEREGSQYLSNEIERLFNVKTLDLCKDEKKAFKISIVNDNFNINIVCSEKNANFKLDINYNNLPDIFIHRDDSDDFEIMAGFPYTKPIKVGLSRRLIEEIDDNIHFFLNVMSDIVFHHMQQFFEFGSPIYFPAARSGLISTKDILTSELWVQTSIQREPLVKGTIADFMSMIYRIEDEQNQYAIFFSKYEKMILKGKIEVISEPNSDKKNIVYQYKGRKIAIDNASSMISELAPIFLYLKYLYNYNSPKNNILIIEEPESHLHPSAQLLFAKFLSYLVNIGTKVVMTTHSPILIQQIQNLLLAFNREKIMKKLNYEENEVINKDDVSITLFYDQEGDTVTKKVDVMDTSLSDTGFEEIYNRLYNQLAYIEMDIEREEK